MNKPTRDEKLRALYNCRNHWQWMQITGSAHKEDYAPSREWADNCACCELSRHNYKTNEDEEDSKSCCDFCPLSGFAWPYGYLQCAFGGFESPYQRWSMGTAEKKLKFYAGRMVYYCNVAIEAYLMEGKL